MLEQEWHYGIFVDLKSKIAATYSGKPNKKSIGLILLSSLLNYGGKNSDQSCMSARFSQDGTKILALRRRLPPILYSTDSTNHLFQFTHPGYYNSCTMKSCSFAGSNDQYILSGSDSFDVYMWQIPTEECRRVVTEPRAYLRFLGMGVA